MNLAIRGIEANLGTQPADTLPARPAPRPQGRLRPRQSAVQRQRLVRAAAARRRALALRRRRRWATPTTPGSSTSSTTSRRPTAAAAAWPGSSWPTARCRRNSGGEGEIRQRIVEADLVDCIVAMPAQLFFTTGIPVCLWFLTRDKTGKNLKHGGRESPGRNAVHRRPQARHDADAHAARADRRRRRRSCWPTEWATCRRSPTSAASSTPSASGAASRRRSGGSEKEHGEWAYRDIPGFCKAAKLKEIAKHGFVLTPGRYVGAEEQEDDGEPFAEKYPRLVAELEEHFAEGEQLTEAIRENLRRISHAG